MKFNKINNFKKPTTKINLQKKYKIGEKIRILYSPYIDISIDDIKTIQHIGIASIFIQNLIFFPDEIEKIT